ncbi:MAG: hypothetical protein ABJM29_07470 [Rhizobiaceae bacterium]
MSSNSVKIAAVLACALLAGCTSALSSRSVESIDAANQARGDNALAFQSDDEFGRGLSKTERGALSTAELQALEFGSPGKPVKWGDEDGPVSGLISVTQPFRVGQSSCRRFTHKLFRKSTSQQANGTACRRQGGAWQLVQ